MQSQGAINVSTLKNDHLKTKQLNKMELERKFESLVKTWDCYNDCPRDEKLIKEDINSCVKIAESYANEKCQKYKDIIIQLLDIYVINVDEDGFPKMPIIQRLDVLRKAAEITTNT